MLVINLGCGANKKADAINIDKSPIVHPDIVLDLATSILPFATGEVDEIYATDILEHIFDPIPLMNECWRVLKKDGDMFIETPYAGTDDFYKDPTHVRGFVPNTFKYFADWNTCPAYGIKTWILRKLDWTKGGENQDRIFVTMRPKK
jgi:predicted SAM-dependent methyltransferase